MRISASLVVLGLGLCAFQLAFSDGALPRIAPLPIGVVPVTAGSLAVLVGLILGLLWGDARYRTASLLALLGTGISVFGLLLMPIGGPGRQPALSVNTIALVLGAALWMAALALGASAIRRIGHERTTP